MDLGFPANACLLLSTMYSLPVQASGVGVFEASVSLLRVSVRMVKANLVNLERAAKAPAIRRIFSSSPRDPRYHMLSYLTSKFIQSPNLLDHEPRAALFINRFTRTSTIMFATNGVSTIMGLEADQLIGKSFYFCIAQNCLQDAVRCLESAKANDSIAYLRFWFRNPLVQDRQAARENSMMSEEDEDEGGVNLNATGGRSPLNGVLPDAAPPISTGSGDTELHEENSRTSSDNSAQLNGQGRDAIFDPPALAAQSSTSSIPQQEENAAGQEPIELEAVVSCTSDGLVVILRRAKAIPPTAESPAPLDYNSGFFASPWAPEPIVPTFARDVVPDAFGLPTTKATRGPNDADFMNSIREVAVFAWSLTGINGSLTQFSRGRPSEEALPPDGFPIWDPNAPTSDEKINGFADNSHRRVIHNAADKDQMSTSSEDEVVYRRAPTMPPWRPVQRRARHEAFGAEGDEEGDARDGHANARRRRLDE